MGFVTAAVVPCRNEVATLERCLSALRAQQPPPRHVVVVDNGSTDGSLEVAARLADEVLEVGSGTISVLRNLGAKAALAAAPETTALCFVDADCEVAPDWSEAAATALRDGADLVGSRARAAADDTWVARRWAAVEARQAHGSSLVWSQHLVVRRSVFEALGGFSETLVTGEDADLSARVRATGGTVRLVEEMVAVHHGFPSDLAGFWRRERWHTRARGWWPRMSGRSRGLVAGGAVWTVLGAAAAARAATGSSRPLGAWTLASVVAVPALGRLAGGARRDPAAWLQDGLLMGLWTARRVARLPRELGQDAGAS